ncbi:MAG: hypothetical protein ACYCRH_13075 [Acidiferrobacteraceae bacterium]
MNKHWAKVMTFSAAVILLAGSALAADAAMGTGINMYGGPVYAGPPALSVTAALVKAGGGPAHFTIQKALVSMLGEKAVHAEVAKLTRQYGGKRVKDWLNGFNFAVHDGLRLVTAAGIKLPAAPGNLQGTKLAETLVNAGTAPDHVFWSGLLFDHALSHNVHNQVMVDIGVKYSFAYDKNVHAITNQALYDVAHALGMTEVRLASLH